MATFTGLAGDDNFTGTFQSDLFDLDLGGDDIAKGKGGNDIFLLGAALTTADRLDGGAGADGLNLEGDYSAGLFFGVTTALNFEALNLAAGYDYNITFRDVTNSSLSGFSVQGYLLGAADSLIFDGSAETTQRFIVTPGLGDDQVTTGAGIDFLHMELGGRDRASGLGGDDHIYFSNTMEASDRADGGDGFDTLYLSGDYRLNFGPNTIRNIESFFLSAGSNYKFVLDDGNVSAFNVLLIVASNLTGSDKLVVNGAAETDGMLDLRGSTGKDSLTGGGSNDNLDGGDGADLLVGGAGDDRLAGGAGHDELTGGADQDTFDFDEGHSPFGNPDRILDLGLNDIVDLSGIDARQSVGGDQALVLVASFTGAEGQLMLDYHSVTNTTDILMDTDGDSAADQIIVADGNRTGFTQFVL